MPRSPKPRPRPAGRRPPSAPMWRSESCWRPCPSCRRGTRSPRLFAGLMSYDAKGAPALEVAQSIETVDHLNYRITLKPGWTFSDGSAVTARSFVNAWNYGALGTNAQLQQSFFSPIVGFDDVAG